ncbi:RIP metalloprotease RseP [Saccharophagus degradans]|uniref:Zinc metalloprotease n=1 Tax=Saccharophagus degradans TaxID=86304 RepID=A0AAW7XE48_9GAMM|nr:RIP metalloprotease RseP [Saccharophagus degradans]MDO6424654.1 RIP metalloprotease RseP [Saccharophagus degradans]MDO6608987.1 RIP metalloprotease RseP [Saccharophagus degradans]
MILVQYVLTLECIWNNYVVSSLSTLLWFLIAISILVAIHEYGHFYVARRCGVKVLRFSIGFGPRLLTWTDKKGTEFALSAIPLGGYVKMLDEREGEVDDAERPYAFSSKKPWQRILIAFAGPLANFIFAILLFWLIVAVRGEFQMFPVVGEVKPNSVAALAGLEAGQEILAIDGEPTPSTEAVLHHLISRLGETGPITFTVSYPDSTLQYESQGQLHEWLRDAEQPDPIEGIGIVFYQPPAVISEVAEGKPAFDAGFEAGDIVVATDGIPMGSSRKWTTYISERPNQELEVEVERAGEIIALKVTPAQETSEDGKTVGRIGVGVTTNYKGSYRRIEYGPGEAFVRGVQKTWETVDFVLLSIKKLILGEISTKNLSGPIGIAKVAGDSAKAGSWAFVSFLAMISVYLGVLNLLPVPVLDGGHILFGLIEWVKGSPLSERVQALGYQAGLAMVLCLMVVAFYNDLVRL